MHRSNIKELIRQGNLSTLEEVVLQGFGDKLLGETSNAPLVQEFLEKLPDFIYQITELHRTAMKGNLREFQGLLDRKSMITARDQVGATPLHKAVLYGHHDLVEYISTNFPETLDARDNNGRTALHYASALDDDRNFYNMLVKAGASPLLPDFKGKNADFYLRFPDQINLQQIVKRSQRLNANYAINTANRIKSKSPSRRKERSLSPSYRLKRPSDTNGVNGDGHSDETYSDRADTSSNDGSQSNQGLNYYRKGIDVSSANLKRWIQENNLEMLEGVVLEGHGNKLKEKAEYFTDDESVDSKMYITETVPQMMNNIRMIHAAVSCGDLMGLQDNLVKKDYILSKDHLGMAPLHKATIMGHIELVEYVLEKFPETVNCRDKEGRTALHYSAATTNRNGNKIYRMLIKAGADPRIRDSSGKTAEYYRVHLLSLPNELSRINSKKKLNPLSLTETQSIKRRPILLPNIQERITAALHDGDAKQLQELVLEGYGDTLFGRTSWGEEARKFLKGLPHLMDQIKTLHASAVNGDLANVERILADDSSLVRARDENGLLPIHIATAHNRPEVVDHLIANYQQCIHLKDSSGRTALHISAQNKTIDIYRKLVEAGGDPKIMDKNGKTADHYLRAQTIHDFVSQLNGENVNNNTNHKILEQNIIDSKELKRKRSKPKIKPVSKPVTKTSKTGVKTNDENSRNEIIVDSTDANNSRSETSGSDISSVGVMTVPSNRLPSLKSDETSGLENIGNQTEVSEEQQIDNQITEQTIEEIEDTVESDTATPVPTAPPLEEQQPEKEPELAEQSENINQSNEDYNQEITATESEVIAKDIQTADEIEERADEQPEQIEEQTQEVNEEKVEEEKEEPNKEIKSVDQEIEQKEGQQQQEIDEPEIPNSNHSEETLNNEEKSGHIISDNQVSDESNQNPEEMSEKLTDPNGDGINAQETKDSETAIIENTAISANKDETELNDQKSGQQIDQTVETLETVDTTDITKDGINSDNIYVNSHENDINSEETNPQELQQTQTNNTTGNEESIAISTEESVPSVINENQNQLNETNGADNQNSEPIKQNQEISADNEKKTGSKPSSRKSSVASNGPIATNRRFSRTLSQQSIGEQNKGRRPSKSNSRQSSQESDENLEPVSRRSSNAGSRRSSIQTVRRKSGTENVAGKSLSRQTSKSSLKETKDDSNKESDPTKDVGEEIVNKAISDSLATIRSEPSFEEQTTEQQPEESVEAVIDQINDTQEVNDILDVEQKVEEVVNVDEKQEEGVNNDETTQNDDTNEGNDTNEVPPTVTDNNVIEDEVTPQTTIPENENNESDVRNTDKDEATAEANDNETPINQIEDEIENQSQEVETPEQEVTQTSDTLVANQSTNDDINDNNENKVQEINEKSDENTGDQTDGQPSNEGSNDQTIEDSSQGVVNDQNNNEDKSKEQRKIVDSTQPNGRENTQVLERSFSRQSTVSTINPHTDDRLNELIDVWIKESDLLRLEHVVIAGQGIRLIGRHSETKQVQDFLDLVPTYMNKIRTVHETVIRGNLNEVKLVLTRKRFALSRDHVGASPLHLAVLHAHLDVMLYIISQFPETINGPDNEGRTPLHYAAVMPDEQKQFYKLLLKAGADGSLRDKKGQTPQSYIENPDMLTIRQLLENYMPPVENYEDEKSAEVWRRPPTADIESRLTPTPDDSDSPMPSPSNNKHEVDAEVHVDAEARRSRLSKTNTFSRSDSQSSTLTPNGEQMAEDEDFETMSNEFKKSLKEEKFRLQKSFDRQMSTPDALAMNGSVVDNVQEAQPPVGTDTLIMNGENSSGYDLTEIKDENGQTVLHQLAAKPHQRTGL